MALLAPNIGLYAYLGPASAGTCGVASGVSQGAVYSTVTDYAREMLARSLVEGLSFQISDFSVGTGGYDPANPVLTVAVDSSATGLLSQVLFKAITAAEYINDTGLAFAGNLTISEGNYALGEMGIWAEILYSPVLPGEVGTKFLFAIAHHPMQAKTSDHTYIERLIIQL